jgi:8-amino-7-oxononanoate synthase
VRSFASFLSAELDSLLAADRLRTCTPLGGPSRVHPDTGPSGGALLSFASNDYLGLAAHPHLARAAAETAAREGFGASASRLVTGDLPAHRRLEQALAGFVDRSSALVFPTGYQTNIGVITALAGPNDLIVSDALNHASLIDGCRLSRARVSIYPHGDALAARRLLLAPGDFRRRLLLTESLFSMDGDVAPLATLAEAAAAADAIFIVDEAHALGALGPGGRGLCADAGVAPDVLVGTLGKALGSAGGFAAGPPPLRDLLLNRARRFIFTTAPPPPVAAAAEAALRIVDGPEGAQLRAALEVNRDRLARGLIELGLIERPAPGPIVPILLGAEARALAVSAALRRRGVFVPAIRPPTVPAGTARLRLTLSAAHTAEDIARLVTALGEAVAENPR